MSTVSRETRSELGVEDAVSELIKWLPEIAAGLKRTAVPDELRPLFSSSSMGPRHIPALAYLLAEGPMAVSHLAARLGVTTGTASLMTTQLAEYGLIERREDPADRRRTLVSVAPGRTDVVETWLRHRAEPIRRCMKRLSGTERQLVARALGILAEELRPKGSRS